MCLFLEHLNVNINLISDQGLKSYAIQVFGSTDLTPEQWKQLQDQRKVRDFFFYSLINILLSIVRFNLKAN